MENDIMMSEYNAKNGDSLDKLLSEQGVAAGVRRIEAVPSVAAQKFRERADFCGTETV